MMTSLGEKKSPADRLLDTASELFAREGIRAVGVDRLLAVSGTARASLYYSFGSKDGLVLAYLVRQDAADQAVYRRAAARRKDPYGKVLVSFDLAELATRRRRVYGCLYLNAAAEFSDLADPINQAVRKHREWIHGRWVAALRETGVEPAEQVSDMVQLLYEGGLTGSQLLRSVEPIGLAKTMAEETMANHRTR
jgi:AcrR family transcriptional regulator